jgi:hypothetical protein
MKIKCKLCGIEEKAIIMKNELCPTCNKITAKQIEMAELKKNPKHVYENPNSPAGRLEQYLISKKIDHIGDMMYMWKKYDYNKRMDKNIMWAPREKYSSIDRVIRTVIIKLLTKEALERVHANEIRNGKLFCMKTEIQSLKRAADQNIDIPEIVGTEWTIIKEFIKQHKPEYKREFEGFKIPPFFFYDCEFDGIEYNHAWDWKLWSNILQVVKQKPKTLAEAVTQMELPNEN